MFTVRFLIGALFAACFCLGNYDNALASHNFSAPELKPVSGSYKIAKSTFLPDADGDLGLSGHSISKYDHNYGDNCAGYNLEACPDGGICSSCPFNLTKKKLVSCKSGFEKSGSSCVASSCGAINSSYKDSIPENQICTKFAEDGKTCYKDCKAVDCSGYNLSCNAPIPNVGGMKKCSDCESASANCNLCRIDFCNYGYKINGKGNGCVELSDECVNGYYKSCETGIHSTGLPTEKGTPCYKCKALDDNCPSGYTKQSCVNGYSATSTTEAGSTCYLCNATYIPVCSGCALNTAVCNGKENTLAIINDIGEEAIPPTACNQFYVGSSSDANFGQGKWYLPAIGEWMDIWGHNVDEITTDDDAGATGENFDIINSTLNELLNKGLSDAMYLYSDSSNGNYWSSSEYDYYNVWYFSNYTYNNHHGRYTMAKEHNQLWHTRCATYMQNKFSQAPKIGDIVYTDTSFSTVDNYDSNKTVAGIVFWVAEDGKSAKIINIHDLTFSSYNNHIDPDNPYGNNVDYTYFTSSSSATIDTSVTNYDNDTLVAAIQGNCLENTTDYCSGTWNLSFDFGTGDNITPDNTSITLSSTNGYQGIIKDVYFDAGSSSNGAKISLNGGDWYCGYIGESSESYLGSCTRPVSEISSICIIDEDYICVTSGDSLKLHFDVKETDKSCTAEAIVQFYNNNL